MILSSVIITALLSSFALTPLASAFAPEQGFTFNDPYGTPAEQYKILKDMNDGLRNAPKGSTVRIAMYSGGVESFNDAVIKAHQRGVNVKIVTSGHSASWSYWPKIKKALGSDTKSRSFAISCPVACFSTKAGTYQHSKFLTFSQTGTAKQVVMVSSANQTSAQAEQGWNNMYTIVGNEGQYRAFYRYFDAMSASASINDNVDYYRRATSGPFTATLSPSQSYRTHPYIQILDNVKCQAKGSYGYKGRTTIRLAMSIWNPSQQKVADKLVTLANQGCRVQVLGSARGMSDGIKKALSKKTKVPIELRTASDDVNGDGTYDKYVHDKALAISGGYGRTQIKAVWTGSFNLSRNAFRYNNDVMLKIQSARAWQSYTDHFLVMMQRSKPMPKVTSSSRVIDGNSMSAGNQELDEAQLYPEG